VSSTLVSAATQLHAQHYPAGAQGIKAGSLPGPGFTVEDDTYFYYADKLPGYGGAFEAGFDDFSYVQSPRLTWMSNWKIFGANYGAAVEVPVEYRHVSRLASTFFGSGGFPTGLVAPQSDNEFGLADIEIQPLLLAWHLDQFDVSGGYSFWAPTGDFDKNKLFLYNLGQGYWTHSFMAGITWYPDKDKTWSVSLLNHYEINMAQYSTLIAVPPSASNPSGVASEDTTLGDIYTLEWAVSKNITENWDVGLTGYYQQQVNSTTGPAPNGPTWRNERIQVAGIGPEIGYTIPKWSLSASLRYAYEFTAQDHLQGNLVSLTLTKTF
jgi:hypothetical protein